MKTIEKRLDILEEKMRAESFRTNKGLGNEVGYYVFDYEAYQELTVRERIKQLENTNTELKFGYQLIIYDLYELILKLLEEEDALEDLKELEEEEGTEYVFGCIGDILKFDDKDSLIVNYILEHTPADSVVFLTGVGKCFPILRSHKILNNLHQVMDHCPVILFYPGKYNGDSLNVFGELKEDNYYRAFPLVER
ncbi:DUF1788 domain-containing protein [Blautia pseudococcoides]|uniref:DUF1788 domain-containing protein n=1 Tax=Blautia pseudococcoides TaxID=1796616 RepID=A0A1C7I5Z9_9FIRM|nr:DUF1788 domain-containing protein [Blautia pseudococcoides]ANU74354.1 hypothetical protein A4V09_00315 [Blautia pseudococcoides]ASU31345.1 DUF1788 domain-containing protein [Blautia pseudococcoides]QJU15600.1 DUF1788 domain-containing protein [Blautia pseudococcoides]QQQ91888.1 DUF1788 domain-containing protein [Blautia pseudococcoides]